MKLIRKPSGRAKRCQDRPQVGRCQRAATTRCPDGRVRCSFHGREYFAAREHAIAVPA